MRKNDTENKAITPAWGGGKFGASGFDSPDRKDPDPPDKATEQPEPDASPGS